MTKKKAKTKSPKWTIKAAKDQAKSMGLTVSTEYDKRYLNTWLYTIGEKVEPVRRKEIGHQPKAAKKPLSMKELIALAKEDA